MAKSKTFKDLGLSSNALSALKEKGFELPTPIQEQAIPVLLDGSLDVIGQAQTGTGKTASFGLPIIELCEEDAGFVQALILTPTRELAIQVAKEIDSLKGNKRIKVAAIYGGAAISTQMRQLKKGVDIVVGTPGRVMDHMKRKTLKIANLSFMVLDEADEMLNMGFLGDIKKILAQTNKGKRMIMFSATMPKEILQIAKQFMRDYVVIETKSKNLTIDLTEQVYYEVKGRDRFSALRRIIDMSPHFYGIIFCKTKAMVDHLAHQLLENNYAAAALHGDVSQSHREKILASLKRRKITMLVATDVAARGIDVNDLTHVVNFSLPQTPEAYVHRIGRTGRAGKKGIAITFVMPSEKRMLRYVERVVKHDLQKKQLPSVDQVVSARKKNIKNRILEVIANDAPKEFVKLSHELMNEHDAKRIISSLLNYAFGNDFDKTNYDEVASVNTRDGDRDDWRSKKSGRRGPRGKGRSSPRRKGRSPKMGKNKRPSRRRRR